MRFKFLINRIKIVLSILIIVLLSSCFNSNTQSTITTEVPSTIEPTPSTTVPTTEVPSTTVPTTEVPSTTIPTVELPSTTEPTTAITTRPADIDYSKAMFASPTGSGNGKYDNPYSIESALSQLTTNKILYLFEGTYNMKEVIVLRNSGTEDYYYKIYALNDGDVILDFGKDYSKEQIITNEYQSQSNKGIVIRGSYYHIKGITVRNCGSTGMHIYGNHNIIENCVLACNGNTGLNVSGSSSDTIDSWPSYNLIKNCTSYGNYDWNRTDGNQGEDADGFGAKLCTGYGNIFDGCIAYNNSDDGWDLFTKIKTGPIGSVTIKNSIAFKNGYSIEGEDQKNGNGFKLGGRAIEVSHTVENCIAFKNKANGFDDNSNPGTLTVTNCTSYANGSKNYAMGRFVEQTNTYSSTWYEGEDLMGPIENVPKSHNIITNCISYNGISNDSYCGTAENSYFFTTSGYRYFSYKAVCNSKYTKGSEWSLSNPFISTDFNYDLPNIHKLYRNETGTICLNDFLKLKDKYSSENIGAKF